jgi:uncharacterized protein YdhG (YjbR/CyaY superfamily)
MQQAPSTVDEYLAVVPEPARGTLQTLREAIRAALPAGTPEGITYGMPTFRHRGSAVVGYAAFKKHCSFFPMSLGIIADFAEELRQYQTSKGTLQFPPEKPLPPPLIGRMVHARVAEIDRKKNRP